MMTEERPKKTEEYRKWLEERFDVRVGERRKSHYKSVTSSIKSSFETSNFWNQFLKNLKTSNDEYFIKSRGYNLLIPPYKPKVTIKPFESFFSKTFRKNVIFNKNWPSEPTDGWILPNNWFIKINDIIRTLIIVKYLDGVEFLSNSIEDLCNRHNISFKKFYEAREEGYYALHLYIDIIFEIPIISFWDTESIPVTIEIQLTTQLQEVIRLLLHRYYEKLREKQPKVDLKKWQWNYQSEEFVMNYLGHMLHYIEGMIMEIREKQKELTR